MRKVRRLLFIGVGFNFGRQVAIGIHLYHRAHGPWEYHLESDNSEFSAQRAKMAIRNWHADGIIAHIRRPRIARLIRDSGIPAVNVGEIADWGIPTVTPDNMAMGRMAARHLMDCGLRNFGFCARSTELSSHKRCEGFMQGLAKSGFGCDVFSDDLIGYKESDWVKIRRRMNRWLLSLKKPVGILCSSDHRAHEVNAACARQGLRVPDDVAIIGEGNNEFICLLCAPPLSSIDLNGQRVGFEAARLLDRLLRGASPPSSPILVFPGALIARQSSDIVALEDPEIAAAIRYIRSHCGCPISVKELLRNIPISRRSMEMRFVKLIGRTPGQEIIRHRIEQAQRLLHDPTLSITTVARDCGFTELNTFSICFRREVGQTPTQFRRSCCIDG